MVRCFFTGKRGTSLKAMWWDKSGWCISVQTLVARRISIVAGDGRREVRNDRRTGGGSNSRRDSVACRRLDGGARNSDQRPAAVHHEIDAVDRLIVEQEQRRANAIRFRREPPGRRATTRTFLSCRIAHPRVAVSDDARMDRVDTQRSELDRERANHRGDSTVD